MDQDSAYLPQVYNMAKEQVSRTVTQTRSDLGIDVEKIKSEAVAEAKRQMMEELTKRRAAAGVTTGTSGPAVVPTDRANATARQSTPEDAEFEAMMNSGPKQLTIDM